MKKTLLLLALATAMQVHALEAGAVVLDFETLNHNDTNLNDAGYRYEEDGFRLVNAGDWPFATYGALDADFSGSTAMINDNDRGVTVLTQVGGGAFSLTSIDLAELALGAGSYSVAFTGTTTSGTAVTQQFTLDGAHGAQTFTFDPGFTNLTSVVWANTPGYHQFDNINVAAVPEPETYAMMLAGLGLVGVWSRRKDQRA